MDQGRLQKRPIKSKAEDPRQNHGLQRSTKTQHSENGGTAGPETTTARGEGGMALRPLLPPAASNSSVPFCFPT